MAELNLAGVTVYIEKSVHTMYDELVSRSAKNAADHPFATMKDLFVLAACAGARANRFKALGVRVDIFSGETFNHKVDVPVLAALAYYKERDLDILLDPKRVVDVAQGWANGGIVVIEEELLRKPGRPLHNLADMLLSRSDN